MRQLVPNLAELWLLYALLASPSISSKPTSPDRTPHDDGTHQYVPSGSSDQARDNQDIYMNYVKQQRTPIMQVHKLSSADNNITCNDGSQIGYYKRLNQHSKSWVIYLQGGGFCGSHESCRQRWRRSPYLMSSKYWPATKTVDGILSSDPKENPYLWNANHIYVPYCSSDSWTGSAAASLNHHKQLHQSDHHGQGHATASDEPESFAFLGSKIVERVFESLYDDLPSRQSLYDAKFVLLAGDSAGATGVIMNLDKMAALVAKRASHLKADCSRNNQHQCEQKQTNPVLRGLADSGWFLDNEPYNFELDFGDSSTGIMSGSLSIESRQQPQHPEQQQTTNCDQGRCTPLQSIKQAMQLWRGQVPESCMQSYLSEPWRCYFGYRVYQTLRTPLFVVQWLYDEAQLMVDNIVRPGTNGQWNYVNKVVNEMRASLENVTALFAPSCLSHSLIARKSWNQINIDGFRLPHILNSWEEQPLLLEASSGYSAISPNPRLDIIKRQAAPNREQDKILMRDTSPSSIGTIGQPTYEAVLVEQEPAQAASSSVSIVDPNISSATTWSPSSAFYLRSVDGLSAQESRNQIVTNKQTITGSPATGSAGNGQAKSRSRKRKRNNQRQQNRIKQSGRHRSSGQSTTSTAATTTATQTGPSESGPTTMNANPSFREADDLHQQPNSSPPQDLLPLMDRSLSPSSSSELLYGRVHRAADQTDGSSARLGRSTPIDDSTLMLSNNVPDDGGPTSRLSLSQSSSNARSGAQLGIQDQASLEARSQGLNYGVYATSPRDSVFGPDQFRFIDSCGWPQCNRDCPVLTYEYISGMSIQF